MSMLMVERLAARPVRVVRSARFGVSKMEKLDAHTYTEAEYDNYCQILRTPLMYAGRQAPPPGWPTENDWEWSRQEHLKEIDLILFYGERRRLQSSVEMEDGEEPVFSSRIQTFTGGIMYWCQENRGQVTTGPEEVRNSLLEMVTSPEWTKWGRSGWVMQNAAHLAEVPMRWVFAPSRYVNGPAEELTMETPNGDGIVLLIPSPVLHDHAFSVDFEHLRLVTFADRWLKRHTITIDVKDDEGKETGETRQVAEWLSDFGLSIDLPEAHAVVELPKLELDNPHTPT